MNHVTRHAQVRTETLAVFRESAAMVSMGQVNARASKAKLSATGRKTSMDHAVIVTSDTTRSSATSHARLMHKEKSVVGMGRADLEFPAQDCARA